MRSLKYAHSFEVVRELPTEIAGLRQLAYNFRWTWHHETQDLFRDVDAELWEAVENNPVELLNRLSADRIDRLVHDEVFLARLAYCVRDLTEYLNAETWFDRQFPGERDETLIAYFCAEFGISECLPIYSGGLGVLAGDHLKAASDLGIPLVGVGLLYSRGYFRQYLNPDGWQQEQYPQHDFYRMPLQIVRGEDGQPTRVSVEFPERTVTCQVWLADVGRVKLYLLDSNILENAPNDQSITDTLYGGDEEMRIRQESILGIGGFRMLEKLGRRPTVCHMNEGHAAFLSIERIRQFMKDRGCDFRTARQCVVAGNVFTTHTPVPAGFDIFPADLLEKYVGKATSDLGLTFPQFLRYGRIQKDNPEEQFNMAVLAMENSNYVNGVSKLHSEVSRSMFAERWPDFPIDEVPIDAVTNGIHTMTWLSVHMVSLLDRHLGSDWREDASSRDMWDALRQVPDEEIWSLRENERGDFVRFCRRHLRNRMRRNNAGPIDFQSVNDVLDPRVLTIGFARRFATYKRATLLFKDAERLKQLMTHAERPVQFVFAGKSHPRDDGGKRLIQEIINFIRNEGLRARMVFLEDYDMRVARELVQGVDVWLNNPRRPMEASGTSGMKVVPNGGLNCSILDGWWAEGYTRGAGWAIGDDVQQMDEGYQDWLDSRALYQIIENEIAPTFYHRTDNGIPTGWVEMMKRSMAELAPRFSTLRMVREYTSRFYVPASRSYNNLASGDLTTARDALAWRDRVIAGWPKVAIVNVSDDLGSKAPVGAEYQITAVVDLGQLQPGDVSVQAIIGQVTSNRELSDLDLSNLEWVSGEGSRHTFQGQAAATSPGHRGYVVRVVPHHDTIRVATELSLVTWEPA